MSWPLIIGLTLGLVWIALQRRAPEPTRWMVSVEPASRPAGWGWVGLFLLVDLIVLAWVWMGA